MSAEIHDMSRQALTASGNAGVGPYPTCIPENSRREWVIAVALFVGTCLYLFLFYDYANFNPDEGVVLQGAQRILQGQVVYRDFFSFFTPGSYYWTAFLFKIFGSSILVARSALVVYGGLFSVFVYLMSRRVCSRWIALFTSYLLTLVCLPFRFVTLHNWDSTVWTCIALYLAVRFLETPHGGLALAAAGSAALTCIFEQSKGAGLVLGLTFGFCLVSTISKSRKFTFQHLRTALAGFALPFLVTIGYFTSQNCLSQMLQSWVWPLRHYSVVNRIPYGWLSLPPSFAQEFSAETIGAKLLTLLVLSPFVLLTVLPILSLLFLAASVFRLRRQNESFLNGQYFVLVSTALAGLLLTTWVSRPDLSHILFQSPLFILVLAWGLEGSCVKPRHWFSFRPFLTLYLLLAFTLLGFSLLWIPLNAHTLVRTRRGVLKADGPDAVLEEIQARVPPGTRIFIYPFQPIYYYLSATDNATKFEFLMPGMHTVDQFEQAREELSESRAPVVIFQQSFPEMVPLFWPSTPEGTIAQRDVLLRYILGQYAPCKTLISTLSWHFVLMERKGLNCKESL